MSQYPDYETLSEQGWTDLKKAKRKLYKEKGYHHYEYLSDEELTEIHFNLSFQILQWVYKQMVVFF